ncbi:hypothetical protein OHJ16_15645 [Actinomyces israelii]|uniref:DUF416 family protein n=1 Tax=Actinomyces israelii TaxID=1659 RepID=A0ABT4ICJ6_9ACTO|nr:hypothetical protein [Actinomyces israelii]MCZ0859466.1 hypothetical protein [Actinomyces israelii]
MTKTPFLGLPDLEVLDHADLAAAALACATRLSPLFAGLATHSDPRGYADLLADMWQLVGQGARDLPERAVNDLDYRLAAFPEAFCDSFYLLDYEACSVLGVGYAALRVLDDGGPEAALECWETALELLGGLGEELDDEEARLVPEAQEQRQVLAQTRAGRRPTMLIPGLTGR